MQVGDRVVESPVGPGEITGFTQVGMPRVNEVAVGWVELADGTIFNPYNLSLPERAAQVMDVDHIKRDIEYRRLLEAVLLFHSGRQWDPERWRELMGDTDPSTKGLCDRIRECLGSSPTAS